MYGNVIIGTDGRQGGRDAARLARSMASDAAHFTLAYVAMLAPVAHAADPELELGARSDLPAMPLTETQLGGENIEITRVYANSVGAGLQDVAAEVDADLIVVGPLDTTASPGYSPATTSNRSCITPTEPWRSLPPTTSIIRG